MQTHHTPAGRDLHFMSGSGNLTRGKCEIRTHICNRQALTKPSHPAMWYFSPAKTAYTGFNLISDTIGPYNPSFKHLKMA